MSVAELKAYNKAKQDRHRLRLAVASRCYQCGMNRPRPQRSTCLDCFLKRKARLKGQREALIQAGICTRCQEEVVAVGSRGFCSACREMTRGEVNAFHVKLRRKLIEAGICTGCRRVQAQNGKRYCEECLLYWRLRRNEKHGLTPEVFKALGTACNICKAETQIQVDHDHEAKIIRGALCRRCNMGLGYFKDDPERLREAARYLERTKPSLSVLKAVGGNSDRRG